MPPICFIDDTPPAGGGGSWNLVIHDNFGAATSGSLHGATPNILNTPGNTWNVVFGSAAYNASNQLDLAGGGAIPLISCGSANHEVEADVKAANGIYIGVGFRMLNAGDYLTFAINIGGVWELYSSESGFVLLASGSFTTVADTFYTLKARSEGNQITLWINGSQVYTGSHSNFVGNTGCGFENAFGSAIADNFKVRIPA